MGRAAGSGGPPRPAQLVVSAPAPTRRDLRPPRSLPPSQPGAGGRPEADVVQSRERAAQGTAPGARRANGGERGGTRAGRLPSNLPGPPASRRAAGVRAPHPPSARCPAFPVSLRQVATRPARELRILGAAARGGAVRQKESPPFESPALLALPSLARWAASAASPPRRPHCPPGSRQP